MLFAPDTEDALEFVVDLVNTAPDASKSGLDEIDSLPQLQALLAKHDYSGRFARDEAERLDADATRTRFRALW